MPTPSPSTPAFYGRESELSRVRMLITQRAGAQIGFYGIGGLGKSTLLDQIAHEAHKLNVTPYIVRINLDPNMGVTQFLECLLDGLRATGKTKRQKFGILKVDTLTPFAQKLKRCEQQEAFPTTQLHIQAHDASTVQHVTTPVVTGPNAMKDTVTLSDLLACVKQLFYKELPVLVTVPPGVSNYQPRRLLILLVDTIEQAQPQVLDLLYRLRDGVLNERCLLISAGRSEPPRPEHTSPLLSQELHLLDDKTVDRWAAHAGIHDAALRTALVKLCNGLPMLVNVAIKTVQEAAQTGQPLQPQDLAAPPPVAGSDTVLAILEQLLNLYTDSLEQGDPRKKQMSLLLRYGCIPRSLNNYDLIRAMQIDGLERDLAPTLRALENQGMLRDGAFHPLLRKAALVSLVEHEPTTWRTLVERAKDYDQREALLDEYLALLLLVGDAQAGAVFSSTIGEALRQQNLALAQRLIAVVAELDTPQHLAWELRLARADLALAQGDGQACQAHLLVVLEATHEHPQRLAELNRRLAQMEERQALDNTRLLAWWLPRQPDAPAILARMLQLSAAFEGAYQYPACEALAQQAHAMATHMGEQSACAAALYILGEARRMQSDAQAAEAYYQQALAIYRKIADRKGEATALRGLGDARWMQADMQAAETYYQQALAIYREIADRKGEAHALHVLGEAHWALGNAANAITRLEQARALGRQIGYLGVQFGAVTTLIEIAEAQGNHAAACGYQVEYQRLLVERRR